MPFRERRACARAQEIGLDPAYVYGLIRQESRFIMDARSGVGASGLMQVMPATARWTAKKIGLPTSRRRMITDRDTNLHLGTTYLKLVLDDFGGSQALAAAAYNAGPGRPRNWRDGPVLEAAIWAENIPFTETRDYVKKVLSQRHLLRARCSAARARRSARASAGRSARPTRTRRRPTRTCPSTRGRRAGSARIGRRSPFADRRAVLTLHRHASNFLVLGGTGFVGRSVCEKLVERSGGADGRIRVATRASGAGPPPAAAADGRDRGRRRPRRRDAGADAARHRRGDQPGRHPARQRSRVRARPRARCRARSPPPAPTAGVRRVIHVSALGVATDAPSRYLRSKARGEAALRRRRLDLTLLRPSVIFGERDRFLNLFAPLQSVLPVMPLAERRGALPAGLGRRRRRARSSRCLDDPSTIGLTIECCGPRVYTLRELVALAGRWSGASRPVLGAAGLARPAAGDLSMELLPGPPLMSRDNLDSMRVANVASGKLPGLERLGIEPTPLEAIAPRYLGHVSGEARLEAWRARARRG